MIVSKIAVFTQNHSSENFTTGFLDKVQVYESDRQNILFAELTDCQAYCERTSRTKHQKEGTGDSSEVPMDTAEPEVGNSSEEVSVCQKSGSISNSAAARIANEQYSQRHRTPQSRNSVVQIMPDLRPDSVQRAPQPDQIQRASQYDLENKDQVNLEKPCTYIGKKIINPARPDVTDDQCIMNDEDHSIGPLLMSFPSHNIDIESSEFGSDRYKSALSTYDVENERSQIDDSEIISVNLSLQQPDREFIDQRSNEKILSKQINRKPKATPRNIQVMSSDTQDQTRTDMEMEEEKQHHRQISRQLSAPSSHAQVVNVPDDVKSSFRESNRRVSTTPPCNYNSNVTFIQDAHPTSPGPHSSSSRVQEVSRMSARPAYPAADYHRHDPYGYEYRGDKHSRRLGQHDTEAFEIRDPYHYATCKL